MWQHHPIVIQDYFLIQPLDSISIPAKSADNADVVTSTVKQISVQVLAKMFLFGSWVKNKALKRLKETTPEESNSKSRMIMKSATLNKFCLQGEKYLKS